MKTDIGESRWVRRYRWLKMHGIDESTAGYDDAVRPLTVEEEACGARLCCAGCKKKLLANPDKYLKKLDEQK